MDTTKNTLARTPGGRTEHRLASPTATACGRDATLMHRYPTPTQANSADRRVRPRCGACVKVA